MKFDCSTFHYKSRRTDQAAVERRIKEICETRVRYGYRRVHVLLRREGWEINMKKTRRIYNELGLQLRNKHPKRRVKAKLREDRQDAVGPNDVWAMDFVHDQLATGKKLRVLTIVDTHTRYCPATDPAVNLRIDVGHPSLDGIVRTYAGHTDLADAATIIVGRLYIQRKEAKGPLRKGCHGGLHEPPDLCGPLQPDRGAAS